MQIGLIGGIGPAAQDYYTRRLIALFADARTPLDMTTVHADAPTLLGNLAADNRAGQAAIFAGLAERLQRAGAGCVAVTSIAGHFCREAFTPLSPLPVIDMIGAVAADVTAKGFTRIGILGTRTVMASRLYGGIASAEVIAPPLPELDAVHLAYAAMATAGTITPAQKTVFEAAAQRLIDEVGCQAILLGGTDLALAFDAETSAFPLVDCAAIHAEAIARHALAAHNGGD
ncbi:MAG: aspartate/glutamate racemase family protein [Sphingomonas sp.]|nr:aspartate/glutamate racemase family protein [Sphingomonas sp.]